MSFPAPKLMPRFLVAMVAALSLATLPASAQQAAVTPAGESAAAAKETGPQRTSQRTSQQTAQEPPKTELRQPTPEEVKVLLEGMKAYVNDSTEGLTVTEHPDGHLSLDHEGRFQNVTVAKINPDGTVSTECVNTLTQVRQFLNAKPPADPSKSGMAIPAKTPPAPKTPVLKTAPAAEPRLEEK